MSDAPVVRIGDPDLPYRRRIRLVRLDPTTVWGGLEDDFHHFEVTLTHDNAVVTGVTMEARRWPWATCPAAGENLDKLVGMPLSDRCTAVAATGDSRSRCWVAAPDRMRSARRGLRAKRRRRRRRVHDSSAA